MRGEGLGVEVEGYERVGGAHIGLGSEGEVLGKGVFLEEQEGDAPNAFLMQDGFLEERNNPGVSKECSDVTGKTAFSFCGLPLSLSLSLSLCLASGINNYHN